MELHVIKCSINYKTPFFLQYMYYKYLAISYSDSGR